MYNNRGSVYSTTQTSCIANGAKQQARTLPKLLLWQDTFGVFTTSGAKSDVIFLFGDPNFLQR